MADAVVRLSVRVNPNYRQTIRGNSHVVFGDADSNDAYQQWTQKIAVGKKDSDGNQAFALTRNYNGETMAIIYAGDNRPVVLVPFNISDTTQLWTTGNPDVDGYFPVRRLNNTGHNLSADESESPFGTGNRVVVANWNGHEHQLWKIEPAFP